MNIADCVNTRQNKVEIFLHDGGDQVYQLDVRVLPNGKVIVEAEHLTAPNPQANGLTFELEDVGATAVLQMPKQQSGVANVCAHCGEEDGHEQDCPKR